MSTHQNLFICPTSTPLAQPALHITLLLYTYCKPQPNSCLRTHLALIMYTIPPCSCTRLSLNNYTFKPEYVHIQPYIRTQINTPEHVHKIIGSTVMASVSTWFNFWKTASLKEKKKRETGKKVIKYQDVLWKKIAFVGALVLPSPRRRQW